MPSTGKGRSGRLDEALRPPVAQMLRASFAKAVIGPLTGDVPARRPADRASSSAVQPNGKTTPPAKVMYVRVHPDM